MMEELEPPPGFDWERWKAEVNPTAHEGVTFAEAVTVFSDPFMLIAPDVNHSDREPRFHALGYSEKSRILLVVHIELNASVRKIISARKASRSDRDKYNDRRNR